MPDKGLVTILGVLVILFIYWFFLLKKEKGKGEHRIH